MPAIHVIQSPPWRDLAFNGGCARARWNLGPRTLVMGILNVTPDSFSDGGKFLARDHAVAHALKMLDDGADLLDIGGESTRPGTPVAESGIPAAEELRRIMPVIEDVLRERPDAILSVDTYKAEVARAAVNAGCEIVNDVSALRWDEQMTATVKELDCGVILMHTRGRPQEWRNLDPSADIVAEVKEICAITRRPRWQAESPKTASCLMLALVLARSSTRTIRCWPAWTSCAISVFRCWWALQENLSSAARWPKTAKTRRPTSAFTARLPPLRRQS